MLDGLLRGLGEVLREALDHFEPLMVLQVHHIGLVTLPEGLELVYPLSPLVERPLASLVELWRTFDPILNVEGLNLEVKGINKVLKVDVVGGWRSTVILVPIESRNMQDSGNSQSTPHVVVGRVLEYKPVQPLD